MSADETRLERSDTLPLRAGKVTKGVLERWLQRLPDDAQVAPLHGLVAERPDRFGVTSIRATWTETL